jgi:hypothetical protein
MPCTFFIILPKDGMRILAGTSLVLGCKNHGFKP